MLRINRVLPVVGLSLMALVLMAGCGGGISTAGPAAAGFNNSSLNGTFAFAISGQNGGGFFTVAGSFQANGNGTITGGTEDINSPGTTLGLTQNVPITGTYAVRSDGRTTATLTTSTNPPVSFGFAFVLLNSQHGLMIRFDNNGTASGSVDQQNSSAFSLGSLAGTFAFNVAGVNSTVGQGPEASAGLLNIDASGNILSGTLDDNNSGLVSPNLAVAPAAGGVAAPSAGSGRGTVTFVSPVSAATVHLAYYVVDTNHLKLIQIDSAPILAGDAFRQSTTPVSGSLAFTLAGSTVNGHGVFSSGGILNTDGAGNILNTSVQDLDDGGAFTPAAGASVTGTYSVSGGRGTMTLAGPENLNLVFYPTTGGLLLLDVDSAIVATGTALAQTGAPFSNASISNGFGLNFTGVVNPGTSATSEIDSIAQFTANGNGSLNGAMDINNFGALFNSLSLSGNYSVSANGRGVAALRTSSGTFNLTFYVVSSSRVLFVELDENFGQISVGAFASQ
jgi:hypothetical protein